MDLQSGPQDRVGRRTEMRRSYLSGFAPRCGAGRWHCCSSRQRACPAWGSAPTAWSWLATALDKSLATRTLLTDLDMNVFVDLLGHHGESLLDAAVGGVLLAVVCWLFGVWLNAVTIAAVGDDLPLAAAAHRGLDLYATFLRLDLLALAVDGLLLIATVAVGRWLTHWTAESPSEMTVYLIVGGSALRRRRAPPVLHGHPRSRAHSQRRDGDRSRRRLRLGVRVRCRP